MEISELLMHVLTQAGPMAAIVFFFVWRDSKTDARNAASRDEANKYIRSKLEELVRENQQLIREHNDCRD